MAHEGTCRSGMHAMALLSPTNSTLPQLRAFEVAS